MRCWVYVDGFNLYNGAAKRTRCKWLNLLSLSQRLRPHDTIERVKYFTALVERRTDDPDQQKRQRVYWRALGTLNCVDRIEGRFSRWPKRLPLDASVKMLVALAKQGCNVVGIRPIMMEVLRSEEKGSDVNLATHLIHDAHQIHPGKTFEAAIVVSTDSDLAEAIRLVTQDVGKPVWVCKPNPKARTVHLERAATGVFDLKTAMLKSSLFPNILADARGSFSKPASW